MIQLTPSDQKRVSARLIARRGASGRVNHTEIVIRSLVSDGWTAEMIAVRFGRSVAWAEEKLRETK